MARGSHEDDEEAEAYVVVAEQDGDDDDESKDTEVSAAVVDVQADESDGGVEDEEENSTMINSRDNVDDVDDLDEEEEGEEGMSVKSEPTAEEDVGSTESRLKVSSIATPNSGKRGGGGGKKSSSTTTPSSARKGRTPAVQGLTIPFRTVKKAMKLDPDIPIVQNEAAIMATLAAELFLKRLARQSQNMARERGRNTIRYEDVAEARTNDASLAFLEMLLP